MSNPRRSVLLIGYGNPACGDDGIGPALADAVKNMNLPDLTVDSDYQLTPEDAHAAASHDIVIFADASITGKAPFSFHRIQPGASSGLGSHSIEPGEVLALAMTLFKANTLGYILSIRGYAFEQFTEQFTAGARRNLDSSICFIKHLISTGNYEESDEPAPVYAGISPAEKYIDEPALN